MHILYRVDGINIEQYVPTFPLTFVRGYIQNKNFQMPRHVQAEFLDKIVYKEDFSISPSHLLVEDFVVYDHGLHISKWQCINPFFSLIHLQSVCA